MKGRRGRLNEEHERVAFARLQELLFCDLFFSPPSTYPVSKLLNDSAALVAGSTLPWRGNGPFATVDPGVNFGVLFP